MNSKELLLANLRLSQEMVLGLAEEMEECCLQFPTAGGGNHALWIMGHLARAEGTLVHELVMGLDNPLTGWVGLFGNDSQAVAEAGNYPPYGEVLKACRDLRADSIRFLEAMEESVLDEPTTRDIGEYFGAFDTKRHCFNMTAIHWLEHKGQLADIRRAAGMSPRFA
ncbi:MAG: DinB family protein [Planctomycetota bacterium]